MSLLEQAQLLASSGFLVFPCRPGEKLPAIKGWPEKATTDPEQIRRWWEKCPTYNVGIHTKDMLVVDVDPKNGGEIPPAAPPTFSVITPSGGIHLYFSCPGGVKNGTNVLGQGVDVRSDRGYVVGPGSRTPKGDYAVYSSQRPAEAPAWLIEAAGAGGSRAETRSEALEAPEGVDQERAAWEFTVWLNCQEEPVEGSRNAALHRAALHAGDLGLGRDGATEVLLDVWGHVWAEGEREEVLKTVDSAYRGRVREVGGAVATDADFTPVSPQEQATADKQPVRADAPLEFLNMENCVGADGKLVEPDYLVKNWLNRGQLALMFGKWSAGKTFTALDIGLHVAAGREWCGKRVRQGGVLMFEYEGVQGMRGRLAALRQAYPECAKAPLEIVPMRDRVVNDAKSGGKAPGHVRIQQAVDVFHAKHGDYPALIIIDPLRDALGGSDSDPERTAAYLTLVRKLRDLTGAAILTVTHVGHGDQSRARGDSALPAAMDVEIMAFERNGTRLLRPTKERDSALPEEVAYKLETVELGRDSDGDPVTSCVFREVENTLGADNLPDGERAVWLAVKAHALMMDVDRVERTDISSALKAAGNFNKGSFDTAWKRLVERELLVKTDDGRYLLQVGAAMEFDTS